MPYLQIKNLTKQFSADVPAVSDLCMDIEKGELVAILGPSGCGKSTLLRMISGLEAPTSGDIVADGKSWLNLSVQERNVAMSFQNYALFPHLNILNNMCFGIRLRGISKTTALGQAKQIAQKLGIDDILGRFPHEVSGGQRQRAALARAILRRPSIHLLDEPLSSLDAQLRYQLRRDIKALQRELGATMLFVTHDQSEAMSLGDRIAVIKNGQLQQFDTPRHIYHESVNTFVASFMGRPGMNLFKAPQLLDQIKISQPLPPILQQLDSSSHEYLMGIRPENLSLFPMELNTSRAQQEQQSAIQLKFTCIVQNSENAGSSALLECTLDETPFFIRLSSQNGPAHIPLRGSRVEIHFLLQHLALFNSHNENRVFL